jgi:hypothetical protein
MGFADMVENLDAPVHNQLVAKLVLEVLKRRGGGHQGESKHVTMVSLHRI